MKFAPLNTPLPRRLQTLATLIAVTFLFVCLALFLWCLLTPWTYPFLILYIFWISIDKAPERNGRRLDFCRRLTIWKHLRDYFPCHLHKTADLNSSNNYLFCYHPHGIISTGMWISFCTEANGISDLFPGITIHPLTISQNFKIPFWREFLLSHGLCSVSRKCCDFLLSGRHKGGHHGKLRSSVSNFSCPPTPPPSNATTDRTTGNAILLVPGGAREALDTKEGHLRLTLNRRKGFVKVALTHGAHLVPVVCFGENDIFKQVDNSEGTTLRYWQNVFLKYVGVAFCMPYGRGIFQYDFGILPQRKELNVVIGRPLELPHISHPSKADVEEWHSLYVNELQTLWDENKDKYAIDRKEEMVILR